jgi:hypothetical protein
MATVKSSLAEISLAETITKLPLVASEPVRLPCCMQLNSGTGRTRPGNLSCPRRRESPAHSCKIMRLRRCGAARPRPPGPQRESHLGLVPSAQSVTPVRRCRWSHAGHLPRHAEKPLLLQGCFHRLQAFVSSPAHLGRLGRERPVEGVSPRTDPAPNAKRLALRPPMRCLRLESILQGIIHRPLDWRRREAPQRRPR